MAKKRSTEPDAGGAEGEGPSFEQALERYERKGNGVSAQRTRVRLAQLESAPAHYR